MDKKRKPVIGVIPLYDDEKASIWMLPDYMDAIRVAGGIPVILPLTLSEDDFKRIRNNFQGYLLTGGHDVNPELYHTRSMSYCGKTNPLRDQLERMIFWDAYEKDVALLGICRGIQLVNALLGGSLYQDLEVECESCSAKHHMAAPYNRTVHDITIVEDTPLYALWNKKRKAVNSYHHQGIKQIGKGLEVMSYAEDGLIEGVYAPDKTFLWGVQWHPEYIYKEDEEQLEIFRSFIRASSLKA